MIYYSPDLPSLCKSSKTLGPTPSDLLDSRECLDIWMEDDIITFGLSRSLPSLSKSSKTPLVSLLASPM